MAKNNASVDFHLADSSWDVSSLYDGDMSGVGDECDTRSNSWGDPGRVGDRVFVTIEVLSHYLKNCVLEVYL
jgi:hypothetical protein